MHRLWADEGVLGDGPGVVRLEGDEARHALRVKRVRTGEAVEVLDGAGRRGVGQVSAAADNRRWCEVRLEAVRTEPPIEPRLEVWSAAPKGDRLEAMVDQLSQAGATAWVPIVSELTERELTAKRLERLERVSRESLKQCGRAWVLEIDRPRAAESAWGDAGSATVLVADASGGPVPELSAAGTVRCVVGPEGGWTADELAAARAAGASVVSLGPHVMRIGTAAVVGAGLLRS